MQNSDEHKNIDNSLNEQASRPEAPPINLRSEAVQDILGRPPVWLIRWGITLIFAVISGLFIGSYFFKYPNIVRAQIVVSTENIPVDIVSRTSGRIDRLLVSDGQRVSYGDAVALIQNPIVFEDYLKLKSEWEAYNKMSPSSDRIVFFPFSTNLVLGELQTSYGTLLKAYHNFLRFITQDYHHQRTQVIKLQIQRQQRIISQQYRQVQYMQQKFEIAQQMFRGDSILHSQGAISTYELERARQALLNALQSIENARIVYESQQINILQSQLQIYELERERQLHQNMYQLGFYNAKKQFLSQLTIWEQTYLLQTPIAGIVSLTRFFQQFQNISAGEVLLTIVPDGCQQLIGRILLPQRGAGEVKIGQSVNVKFEMFPYLQYGMVRAKIRRISTMPIRYNEQQFYIVEVEFPNDLETNFGRTLTFFQNMEGAAEIITEDLRLLDRFLNPIRSVLKR